ncbi:hypothetical protein FF1_034653 [Malus domestica]
MCSVERDRKAEAEAEEARVGFWDEEEEGLEREVAMKERTEAMVKKRRGAAEEEVRREVGGEEEVGEEDAATAGGGGEEGRCWVD